MKDTFDVFSGSLKKTLSLGTQSVSLIEMTNAYAAIASGGITPPAPASPYAK